jgi:FtsZ-binding cell division protein ZapB
MIKEMLSFRKKEKQVKPRLPVREKEKKLVDSKRFNEMIDYYTAEVDSRVKEIKRLKEENYVLIGASVKSNRRCDALELECKKLREEIRVFSQRLSGKSSQ